jgi:hypothetical protein
MGPHSVIPIPSCNECGLASSGRCPACHRHLCSEHFARADHEPCATRMRTHAEDYRCYVCGVEVEPRQWSGSMFAHYIDYSRCYGCRRYICDEQHTRRREEAIEIVRDGSRSQRYFVTRRYCHLCAPLRPVGGIVGLSRWIVAIGGAATVVSLVVAQFLR